MSSILNAYNETRILQEKNPNNAVVISYIKGIIQKYKIQIY
ncbi:hypothetical protein [Campylobacter jejuni]|nr:hypothetical protein [Campylobacter jejuni]